MLTRLKSDSRTSAIPVIMLSADATKSQIEQTDGCWSERLSDQAARRRPIPQGDRATIADADLACSAIGMNTEPILQRMKILIVDDEPVNVAVLEDILSDSGYTRIHSLTDSRKAIATCAEFDPDMILLDLMMPYVDGFTILEGIRAGNAIGGFLPVLILTADMSQETKRRALKCGATDFLLKPFDQIEVLLRIHNLLHWRQESFALG